MIDSSSQEDETQTPATSMDASSPKLTTAVEESQGAEGYDSQIFPGVHLVDSLEGLTSLEDGQASSEPLFDFRQTDALLASLKASGGPLHSFKISTCSGKTLPIRQRKATTSVFYEPGVGTVAARSRTTRTRNQELLRYRYQRACRWGEEGDCREGRQCRLVERSSRQLHFKH